MTAQLVNRPNQLRRRFTIWTLVLLVVAGASAYLVLVALGNSPPAAGLLSAGWAGVPQGLAWAIAEVAAPGWVIRWRERLIAGESGARGNVGAAFSKLLAISGDEPWRTQDARRRTRALGLALIVLWIGIAALLAWLAGPVDSWYASRVFAH